MASGSFNGAPAFQPGIDSSSSRNSPHLRQGFNGAPAFQPGIDCLSPPMSVVPPLLQWSPGLSARDSTKRPERMRAWMELQWSPGLSARDSGAAADAARQVDVASMEPRPFSQGLCTPTTDWPVTSGLQWSPGLSARDSFFLRGDNVRCPSWLQWSPGLSARDSASVRGRLTRRRCCFNGAPAFQPGIGLTGRHCCGRSSGFNGAPAFQPGIGHPPGTLAPLGLRGRFSRA